MFYGVLAEDITNLLNRATNCLPRLALMQERQYR
jgi:hypothetical protein